MHVAELGIATKRYQYPASATFYKRNKTAEKKNGNWKIYIPKDPNSSGGLCQEVCHLIISWRPMKAHWGPR